MIRAMERQRSWSCLLCLLPAPRRQYQWRNQTPIFSCTSYSSPLSTSSSSNSPKAPTKAASSWERSAKLVKNTDVTNPYLDRVRAEVVDPALQLKTIEDELCGAIGKALGKQGEKVLMAIRQMKEEQARYLECIRGRALEDALRSAQLHNDARKRAIKARWELLVHRQAVGFTVDNHRVVIETFPISEAPLPEKMEEILAIVSLEDNKPMPEGSSAKKTPKKVWGDQLSWWQSVGRWR